jgi:hypothetical protein
MSLTKATYSMIEGAPSNVVDLGADNTGVADSVTAFQTAGASVSTVNIPDGTFSISANVPLTVAKSFTGNGKKTLVQTTAGFGATPIFTLSPPASTDPKTGAFLILASPMQERLHPYLKLILMRQTNTSAN